MICLGLFLLMFGLVIKFFSLKHLKTNTTWRIQKPNSLVKTGIYQNIRHPLYLGELIGYFGLSLILTNSIGISIMLFITILKFFLDRIDREENFLCSIYGQEYVEYFKKSWMLIPHVL